MKWRGGLSAPKGVAFGARSLELSSGPPLFSLVPDPSGLWL